MKSRRVGTISMAIVLIGFGILIFISQVNQVSALELTMKFWPSILILLGAEILWFGYKGKTEDGDIKIKYDVFSVFIVMIILAVNIGLYGLLELGLIDSIKSQISSVTVNYDLPLEEHIVDSSIEKIIIRGARFPGSTIRTGKVDKVTASGFINIRSHKDENVEGLVCGNILSVNKSGNTMYITVKDRLTADYNVRDLNIIIPYDKEVEIIDGNNIQVIMDSISKDLLIDNVHNINLRIGKDSNLKIETVTNNMEELKGNVKWNTSQIGDESDPKYKWELTCGDGKNKINIINSYDITVDEI